MKAVFLATLMGIGIALASTSAGSATVINNAALKQIAKSGGSTLEVRHRCHRRYRSGWRWC
jgi:hypothetical protein